MGAFFKIPLNLPHAATISVRILYHLRQGRPAPRAIEEGGELGALLDPYRERDGNGEEAEARRVTAEAAGLGRAIVAEIEKAGAGTDRLGQQVRNLFECLELGEEGAQISLRAGENPDSLLRPK